MTTWSGPTLPSTLRHGLEQASRYKSDFLANMSHELRTPLNSSLILAKLLADNPNDNLTEEQVKYAQTIQSSGNDLLNLINDILDLSKIEAGHVEIRPETITVERLANNLRQLFQPVAREKKVDFAVEIAAECPEGLETDVQRLEQVLKNLLSNAFKFTEAGKGRIVDTPRGRKGKLRSLCRTQASGSLRTSNRTSLRRFIRLTVRLAGSMGAPASAFRFRGSSFGCWEAQSP